MLSLLDHFDDPSDGGIARSLGGANFENSLGIDRSGENGVARLFLDRDGFSGDGGLIHRGISFDDFAVEWRFLAWFDEDDFARLDLGGGDLPPIAVLPYEGSIGGELHKGFDRAPSAANVPGFGSSDNEKRKATAAPSACSPMATAPSTATVISTFMSSESERKERSAFGKTRQPPVTMAIRKAASGFQPSLNPSHCSSRPSAVAKPEMATRIVFVEGRLLLVPVLNYDAALIDGLSHDQARKFSIVEDGDFRGDDVPPDAEHARQWVQSPFDCRDFLGAVHPGDTENLAGVSTRIRDS